MIDEYTHTTPEQEIVDVAMGQLDRARSTVVEALQQAYPMGSTVEFMIMHNQINPSTGIVTYHNNDGTVVVRHLEAKGYRQSHRSVYYGKIVSVRR